MATYTTAYSRFTNRMAEIDLVRSVARDIEKREGTRANLETTKGLCRGGIVLLCSHIEGYIEDLASLGLNKLADKEIPKETVSNSFKYHLSRDLIVAISGANQPESIAEKVDLLFQRDGHIWDSTTSFTHPLQVEKFVGRFSTPTHENIRRFFGRFGYVTFNDDLAARLKANFPICSNMVEQVVDQRNKIAHGDFLAYRTPSDLQEMCKFVRMYCRYTDLAVGNWFKGIGCSIRD